MSEEKSYISAIGQDSHRFESEGSTKQLVLGGVVVPGCVGLAGNSDADVVLHAITNAISGLHGVPVIGKIADDMCLGQGIIDSRAYLAKALEYLTKYKLLHVSVALEAGRPRLAAHVPALQKSIASLLGFSPDHSVVTVTSGEGLTAFGRGEGIQAFAVVSARSV